MVVTFDCAAVAMAVVVCTGGGKWVMGPGRELGAGIAVSDAGPAVAVVVCGEGGKWVTGPGRENT